VRFNKKHVATVVLDPQKDPARGQGIALPIDDDAGPAAVASSRIGLLRLHLHTLAAEETSKLFGGVLGEVRGHSAFIKSV
jgi:hypothetical protein